MNIQQLFLVYGKPVITLCSMCSGNGCDQCNHFGYTATARNTPITYTYLYPMYIETKKRFEIEWIKNITFFFFTAGLVAAIVISYIINFIHNG